MTKSEFINEFKDVPDDAEIKLNTVFDSAGDCRGTNVCEAHYDNQSNNIYVTPEEITLDKNNDSEPEVLDLPGVLKCDEMLTSRPLMTDITFINKSKPYITLYVGIDDNIDDDEIIISKTVADHLHCTDEDWCIVLSYPMLSVSHIRACKIIEVRKKESDCIFINENTFIKMGLDYGCGTVVISSVVKEDEKSTIECIKSVFNK